MTGYAGQYNAQKLTNWTSEWGGGTLPRPQHGEAKITPGMAVVFHPGGPWDTFYQLQRMAAQNEATEVVYHTSYVFPTEASLALCQALEFEIQRNDGQRILNGGVQFDLKDSGMVRTYDFIAGKWVPTSLKVNPAWLANAGVLDVVCVYDLAISAITWRGLKINGTWNPLGISRAAKLEVQTPYLNYAFQYDCTAQPEANMLLLPGIDITVT